MRIDWMVARSERLWAVEDLEERGIGAEEGTYIWEAERAEGRD